MLWRRLFSLAVLVGLVVCSAPRPAMAIDDAILAIVNDDVITIRDLREYMKGLFAQLRIEGKSPEEIREIAAKYESKGIDQLIDDRLILAEAVKTGIMIKPKVVNDRLEEIKKKYASTQDFLNSAVKEGMSISDIRKKIEDQFKGQIMVNQEVREKIAVNPQEVTEYYNSHKSQFQHKPRLFLQSIFVKKTLGSDDARGKMEMAMAEIKGGADFRAVSAKYSELPSVGEMNEEDLKPELKSKILLLNNGDVSGILEVDNGYYIFKLEGRSESSEVPLKEVKDQIYQQLMDEKFKNRFTEWIAGLRKKAYVEIKP